MPYYPFAMNITEMNFYMASNLRLVIAVFFRLVPVFVGIVALISSERKGMERKEEPGGKGEGCDAPGEGAEITGSRVGGSREE